MPDIGPLPAGLALPVSAGALNESDSKALLAKFGIPITRDVFVPLGSDVHAATASLSPPFAVKIVAAAIAHKSDVGGVKLNVQSAAALSGAAAEVVANARAGQPGVKIDGILVAEMAAGVEVLVGIINDSVFGPTVALGLGGVMTEILGDITYRIAPFDLATAHDMIAELKGARLFNGYRGSKPADREALAQMLVDVSKMAMALSDRIQEIDINPVFVRAVGDGVVAADAYVVLR